MRTINECAADESAGKKMRVLALLALVAAAALGVSGCAGYYGPGYAVGYGAPYGYGYGYPYYGYPYYGNPYGYGGASIVISGARYRGYRYPYYRNRYYPRAQIRSNTPATRAGRTTSRPPVRSSNRPAANPRTQATVPQ